MVLPLVFPYITNIKLNIYAMSVKDIHQKDNVVDYRSTDGGDGRLRGGIQRYRLVELAYSPRSVGREAPIVVAKRLKGAKRPFLSRSDLGSIDGAKTMLKILCYWRAMS